MWRIWILCIYPIISHICIQPNHGSPASWPNVIISPADSQWMWGYLCSSISRFNRISIPSMNASTFWTRNAKLAGSYPALNRGALRCAVPPRFPDIFGAVFQHLDSHDGCGFGVWTLYCMMESQSWVVPLKLTLKFPGMSSTSCPVCSGWKWRCVVNFTVNIPLNSGTTPMYGSSW